MQATKDEITTVEIPAMKLPRTPLPMVRWPTNWPEVKWVEVKWPRPGWAAKLTPRKAGPAPALAVLDKFANYRLPALATKTMLPLVLAIGVLLLAMVRVEFIPASEMPVNDINGSKFAPIAANELGACQAQSWPNFSADCIKSPTQLAAARRVDVR